jgi:hypothetical protein
MKHVWTIATLLALSCANPQEPQLEPQEAPPSVAQLQVYKDIAHDIGRCDITPDGRMLVPSLYGPYWINIDARLKKSLEDSVSCEMPTALPNIQQYNNATTWWGWKVPKD